MLYEDVGFETLSDRYTNSRMVPFLTHIDEVRADLFSINTLHKMTPTIVNQQLFFHRILDAKKKSFPSNTAEMRPIYLKMGHIMRKPVFVICEQQRNVHPRSLISAFVVRCLDSNEILQLKATSRFHPAGKVLQRFCFPVSVVFVINLLLGKYTIL